MKTLDKMKLWFSPLTDKVYMGVVTKGGTTQDKKEVTNEFLDIVVKRWENQTEEIQCGLHKWEITVKKLKP